MQVRKIVVPKTARYMVLGKPGPGIRRVWFVCHGYGQLLEDFVNGFQVLDDGAGLVVAPEGLHRFYVHGGNGKVGASWMTRQDRLDDIGDYTEYLNLVFTDVKSSLPDDAVNRLRVDVLGFSQGAATAWRWAMNRDDVDRVILWGGDVPQDNDWDHVRQRFKSMELQLVAGDKDPFLKPAILDLQIKLLEKQGISPMVKTFPGSHFIDKDVLIDLSKGI